MEAGDGVRHAFRDASFPVSMRTLPRKGRAVVADRPIATGELLLESDAYCAVPFAANVERVCSLCFRTNNSRMIQCGECRMKYYCGEECHRRDWNTHGTHGECALLREFAGAMQLEGEDVVPRAILRAACARRAEAGAAKEAEDATRQGESPAPPAASPYCGSCRRSSFADVMGLISHSKKQQAEAYLQVQRMAEALSTRVLSGDSAITTDVVTQLAFAAQSNAHAISDAHSQVPAGLGFFPAASMVNHSCIPNAHHYFAEPVAGQPPRLVFRAIRPIAAGEEVTYSYTKTYDAAASRRETLRRGYFFTCECPRCEAELAAARGAEEAPDAPAPAVPAAPASGETADTAGTEGTEAPEGAAAPAAGPGASKGGKGKRKKKKNKGGAPAEGTAPAHSSGAAPAGSGIGSMDDLDAALMEAALTASAASAASAAEPCLPVPERYLVVGAANPRSPGLAAAEVLRVSQRLDAEVDRAIGRLYSAPAASEGSAQGLSVERFREARTELTAALLRAAAVLHPRHHSMFKAYTAAAQPAAAMLLAGELDEGARWELARERVRFCAYIAACLEGSIGANHPESAEQYRLLAEALAYVATAAGEGVAASATSEWAELDAELGSEWLVFDKAASAEKAKEAARCCARMTEVCFGPSHAKTAAAKEAVKQLRSRLPAAPGGRKKKGGKKKRR